MRFISFIVSFLMFLSSFSFAQNEHYSGIRASLKGTSGNEKIDKLILLADSINDFYPDSCIILAQEALQLARHIGSKEHIAKAHNRIALGYILERGFQEASAHYDSSIYYAKNAHNYKLDVKNLVGKTEIYKENFQYDSALILLEKAKKIALEHNYQSAMGNIYNNMANIFNNEGNNNEAIKNYIKAAEIFREQKYWMAVAIAYQNIGIINTQIKNYKAGIEYFKLAVDINEKGKYLKGLQKNYNSLGIAYAEIDSIEQARYYYNLSLENAHQEHNEYDLAKAHLNIANFLKRQEIFDEAKAHYDSAYYYCEKNNILIGLIITKLNLGNFFSETKQYDKSLQILREAQKAIAPIKHPDLKAAIYGSLSTAFKHLNIYDSALFYFEQNKQITDSISSQESKNTIFELEKKYQSERKAREIAELHNTLEEEKMRSKAILYALIVLAVVLILFVLLFLARRRANRLADKLRKKEYQELTNTMELRNQELVSKALMVSNLNGQLDKIHKHIKLIKPSLSKKNAKQLDILVEDLEITLPEHAWSEFETRFEQVHQGFFKQLAKLHPELSPTELKICSLLRLNMSTKDIALLTNRSVGTVDNIRCSIRRKLDLQSEDNLTAFLLGL